MTAKVLKTKTIPPDGGWGWVVLISALVVNFLIPGTVKSFGVLFVEFLHVFKASPTAASWMPALCYFLYNSLGPLSSVLSSRYSYKTVTIVGGAFAASGMMLSYFANSVSYLYVSYGLMVGIGAGLTFPPTVYIVTAYFERLRGFANGLCISGSAIGTIVLPPFLQYLLDCFGYRGAVLIMGAITLNTLVCGLLYHPVEQHMIQVPVDEGIDNEALTLDEPPIEKDQQPTVAKLALNSGEIVRSTERFADYPSDDIATTTRQLRDLSGLLDSADSALEGDDETAMHLDVDEKSNVREDERGSDSGAADGGQGQRWAVFKENDDGPSETSQRESGADDTSAFSSRRQRQRQQRQQRRRRRPSFGSTAVAKLDKLSRHRLSPEVHLAETSEMAKGPVEWKSEGSSLTLKGDGDGSTAARPAASTSVSVKLRFFDLSVLRDPIYLVILISNSTSAISNTNFMILLPSYAISQGFDKNWSALLLSVVSALDLVGRIGGASLSDIDFVPKYYYFVCGLGMSGIALALLPMANSYTMLAFFCALFGLSSGMYIGITTVILADMLGTEKLSSSYGISLFVNGVLQLVGPPVCGVIFESVGSYKPIFLAFGIILILGTALWAVVPLIKRLDKKQIEVV